MDKRPKRAINAVEFDKHVERCLSMVLHYEEVQQLAEIAKGVFRRRLDAKEHTEGK